MTTRLGRAIIAIGVVGVLAATAGTVVGWRLLGALDRSLAGSVEVTADAVDALAETVDVAATALEGTTTALRSAANTTTTLAGGVDDAVAVLDGAADVTGGEVAGSLEAVQDALPALIDVAGVVDTTLGAVSRLPFGPTYDPDEPFDESLRVVAAELDGLPDALRDEARLLRDGAVSLDTVGDAVVDVGDDLRALTATLEESQTTLGRLEQVTTDAARTLDEGSADVGGSLTAARWLVLVLGVALGLGQGVPIGVGLALTGNPRARAILAAAVRPVDGTAPDGQDASP